MTLTAPTPTTTAPTATTTAPTPATTAPTATTTAPTPATAGPAPDEPTSARATGFEQDAAADRLVDAATAGDAAAFAVLVERHRRELHGHCYRMLRSPEHAEDVVQETLLRAWRARASFSRRSTFRTWLHRIATNACLDEIRRARPRAALHQVVGVDGTPLAGSRGVGEVVAPAHEQPDAVVVARESVEAALLAAVQLLPPRQRAVLVLRDVLRCSAAETAELLGTSVAGANSALQRARDTLDGPRAVRAPGRAAALDPGTRALLRGYAEAVGRDDAAAVVAVAVADVAAA